MNWFIFILAPQLVELVEANNLFVSAVHSFNFTSDFFARNHDCGTANCFLICGASADKLAKK